MMPPVGPTAAGSPALATKLLPESPVTGRSTDQNGPYCLQTVQQTCGWRRERQLRTDAGLADDPSEWKRKDALAHLLS